MLLIPLTAGVDSANASASSPPLATVPRVDLQRYMGQWYEIARIPHRFQEGCIGSTATYSLLPNGEVEVINRCRDERTGELRQAKGRAWSVDPAGNSRLKVSFFWPFRGDYWIIGLGDNYEYSVVGAPNRDYLWILSRTSEMAPAVYESILEGVRRQGFDVSRLERKP
jgi:apolipoprotein D and lipocalin family protein